MKAALLIASLKAALIVSLSAALIALLVALLMGPSSFCNNLSAAEVDKVYPGVMSKKRI
jgi:hypothetical protein